MDANRQRKRHKMATATKEKKRKAVKNVGLGVVHIQATFNNTLITVTDKVGNVLASRSSGGLGFSGSKKSTPFAAAEVAKVLVDKMKDMGITQAEVVVKGVGSGRDSALRVLGGSGVDILSIADRTPVPHNGCRPRKERRA